MTPLSRRHFLRNSSTYILGLGLAGTGACSNSQNKASESVADQNEKNMEKPELFFKISLAQWSLHRAFDKKELDPMDFAKITRQQFDLGAVEYVNSFYTGKAEDQATLMELKTRAEDQDVKSLLIMVDNEGDLGNPDDGERKKAVENHYKWIDAAKTLGCHSIRVNGFGEGSKEEVGNALVEGLGGLATYAQKVGLNVVIENHGLYSSDGKWVANVIQQVNMPNCGTLPDFGNFCMAKKWGSTQDGTCTDVYDRYQGVTDFLPFAKGVSAKSYAFDQNGDETTIDYYRMLKIVKAAGFDGYVGIEYEGSELSEPEGIEATKRLLLKAGMI